MSHYETFFNGVQSVEQKLSNIKHLVTEAFNNQRVLHLMVVIFYIFCPHKISLRLTLINDMNWRKIALHRSVTEAVPGFESLGMR